VVDATQLAAAISRIRDFFPGSPIGGVMQAAMVLDDCLLGHMTAERFRRVAEPKIRGTDNLLKQLAGEPLRFFVLFSSVSAVVGNLAQSNYAAANAYLDALAHSSRKSGLPLISINWGAIGDVGYVAERKDLEESMKKRGFFPLPIDHAFNVLQWAITDLPVQVVASPVVWKVAANTLPSLNTSLFRSLLVEDGADGEGSGADGSGNTVSVFQHLSAVSADQRADVLRQSLRNKLSSMLGVSAEDIEMSNKLTDLGVDSLMAVELKNWIDKETRISLSVLDLTGGKSIDELALKILSLVPLTSVEGNNMATTATSSPPPTEPMAPVEPTDSTIFECYQRVTTGKPKARLVCFPYLGADASIFRSWTSFLASDVELYAYKPQRLATWEDLMPQLSAQLALIEKSNPSTLQILIYYS